MKRQEESRIAYFSLGSNLGDREGHLLRAVKLLEDRTGERAISSRIYRSEPWGYTSENDYYNCCIALLVTRLPGSLFRILKEVEAVMGRTRSTAGYADREIDIDLLLLGDRIVREPELILPHPRLHERRFVLQPLAEIAPLLRHPVLNRTVSELLADCPDPSPVTPL
jgi:2-amino-4-hydroxy-6-hydroxymethyldihydropteridine diphosphokinase